MESGKLVHDAKNLSPRSYPEGGVGQVTAFSVPCLEQGRKKQPKMVSYWPS